MVHLDRERLLWAALGDLEEKGREAMSIGALISYADMSEEEFAAAYGDLDSCLLDAYGLLTSRLLDAVQSGCATADGGSRPEAEWADRVRCGLDALLRELAGRPATARTLAVTFPSLGPTEQARYLRFVCDLADLLGEQWKASGREAQVPGEVEMLAVGAGEAIVVDEVRAGRASELAGIGPEILFSVLVPYIGSSEASAEMERAREKR